MTTELLSDVARTEVMGIEEAEQAFEVSPFDVNIASIEDLHAVFALLTNRFGGRMPLRKDVVADLHRALRQYAGYDFIVARDKNENIIGVATGESVIPDDTDDVCAEVEVYEAGYLAVHPCYEGQGVDEELARGQITRVREWGHLTMSILADPVTTKVAEEEHAILTNGENGVVFAVFPETPVVELGQ